MRGCGSRQSTPPINPLHSESIRYETNFYEWQALVHVAGLLGVSVLTNVRQIRPPWPLLQSPEIDGVIEINGRYILIEVKSYGLDRRDITEILGKYQTLGHDELILVAPFFHSNVGLPRDVRPITFAPSLSKLADAYSSLPYLLPPALEEELQNGEHHFRFVSAYRRRGEVATFRNQVDKKIHSVSQVFRDINRQQQRGHLPVRVFWSVSRWLFPKELFFSSYSNYLVRRGLVFDIDGRKIHNPSSPCELRPGKTICERCLVCAKTMTLQLLRVLSSRGLSGLQVVFSGRQGFHVYVLGCELPEPEVASLVQEIAHCGLEIDSSITLDRKSIVTFPGSIHGLSMLRAVPVPDLETFDLDSLS